jgi:hypothetical protein
MRVRKISEQVYEFFCPGCKEIHTIHVNGKKNASGASWGFDLNMELPTFTPSIHLRTGTYADPSWKEPEDPGTWSVICHSFVTRGRISFLFDCTHELRGQEVDLPEIN